MKTYRIGFLLALIGNIILAVILVGLWLHYRAPKPMADAETKKANSAAQDSMANSMVSPPASTEAPLVPVQISPQRLQSIGVKTGRSLHRCSATVAERSAPEPAALLLMQEEKPSSWPSNPARRNLPFWFPHPPWA